MQFLSHVLSSSRPFAHQLSFVSEKKEFYPALIKELFDYHSVWYRASQWQTSHFIRKHALSILSFPFNCSFLIPFLPYLKRNQANHLVVWNIYSLFAEVCERSSHSFLSDQRTGFETFEGRINSRKCEGSECGSVFLCQLRRQRATGFQFDVEIEHEFVVNMLPVQAGYRFYLYQEKSMAGQEVPEKELLEKLSALVEKKGIDLKTKKEAFELFKMSPQEDSFDLDFYWTDYRKEQLPHSIPQKMTLVQRIYLVGLAVLQTLKGAWRVIGSQL